MNSPACRCFLRFVQIAAVVVFASASVLSCEAQSLASDTNVDNGTHWYGSYDGVHENVSLSSGNVSFCIPLVSLQGRAKHNLSIPLCYNSQFQELGSSSPGTPPLVADVLSYFPWTWAPNTPVGDTTPPMGPGWSLSGAPAYYAGPTTSLTGYPTEYMPDGARYSFPSSGGLGPDGQNADLYTYNYGQTVITKDGTRWIASHNANSPSTCPTTSCSTEVFTDGNSIFWTGSTVTDTIGRVVTVGSGSTFSGSGKISSTAYIQLQYPDSSGTNRTVTVQMSTMQFSCSNNPGNVVANEVGSGFASMGAMDTLTTPMGPYSMPTAIILPDGLTYTFQYDQCGMLRKVTYPSGGYTRYDYVAQQYGASYLGYNDSPSIAIYYQNQIAAKHVCPTPAVALGATIAAFGDNCPVAEETTTYTPTVSPSTTSGSGLVAGSNTQNIVIDPVGNRTVYQFSLADATVYSGVPAVETSRQMFDASGKLWKTVTTQYANTTAPQSTEGSYFSPVVLSDFVDQAPPALPTIQTTTLDNGMVSQIQWSYNLWNPSENDSVLTEERDYDYGQGAPGSLLKRTDYTWLHRDNPNDYGWNTGVEAPPNSLQLHICDRKTSETVYDGNGKLLEQTKYVYDNGAPAAIGAHGLLTSVSKWRSTDGAWLTTSYTYELGLVTSKTDPKGYVTQYSYADNYADGINRYSSAFLTQTTDPMGHVTQNQYYWGSGLVAASCGENFSGACKVGLTSGADYAGYTYDLMGRKTSTTTGDGGQSTTTYSEMQGAPYPLQVTSTETISSGVNKVSAAVLDGEARTVRSELLSDPSCPGGTVNVDTTYDLDGRKSTVTNPYCSNNTGAPTSGTTTYTYDGLSRVTQVTHPDGTYATNTYTGRAVLSADEGNGASRVQRISQSDALGRLIYVCEITGATQQGSSNNTPAACGLDVSGTGFLTTYGYDSPASNGPLESLTNVTQGGVSRSFIYDSLGELKLAMNPESGTTTYTYDNDSNLTSKTDALGKTTTYSYDVLNRLTGKSYSDGTASACFQYDATVRGIGRLATEWTQAGACSSAPPNSGALTQRSFASYDLMGRVAADQQCATLGNCTSSSVDTVNYTYDLAGDVSTFANGLTGSSALSFTNQYNSAGRLSSVTDSVKNIGLFTTTGYTPAGALSDAMIGPGITFHRDYNSRLLPTDEVDTVGTTPGTATVQLTGADQISAYSTGSITFSGAEQSSGGVYDGGLFIVQVGTGLPIQIQYGQNSTPITLASILASVINCASDGVQPVISGTGSTVDLVSCTSGTNVNYPIVAYADGHTWSFAQYSFSVATSGATMTPVVNASTIGGIAPTGSTTGTTNQTATSVTFSGSEWSTGSGSSLEWNTGSIVVFVWTGTVYSGSPVKVVSLTWGQTSTPSSLAASLAAAFSPCSTAGTLVTASLSASTVSVSSCTGTSYVISAIVSGTNFAPAAFSALTNGSTPGTLPSAGTPGISVPGGTYDSGTVALTLNGTQIASASYGSSSTPTGIASALVSASVNNDLVTLQANGANLIMTAVGDGALTDYSYALKFTPNTTLFATPSFAASVPSGALTGGQGVPLYNWAISSYAPNGDVLAMTDKVMGSWTYTYDTMNRLTSGTASAGVAAGLTLGWTYDRYGNRWAQNATGTGSATAVQGQLSFTGNNNRIDGWLYDAAGNLLYDNINHYTYDAENRIATLNGAPAYIYDAEGRRVAKTSSSGLTAIYILGLGGEQVSELTASGAWRHSNVFAGGRLLASYEGPAGTAAAGYHFHLTDWLGTNRMQTTFAGNQEETCTSYPFGDGLNCSGASADATEHHFTGKERDAESGLDYFGARYLSSNMGRWMIPDWASKPTAVPYAQFGDPQSLNLYIYVGNNPYIRFDPDGHDGSWELAKQWLNVVEVSVSLSYGAKYSGQLGAIKAEAHATFASIEGKIGLGGGGKDIKGSSGVGASLSAGPAKASASLGGELSAKDGASASLSTKASVGPTGYGASASVDKEGVHTSAGPEVAGISKDEDCKIGASVTEGVGIGASINLSQAGRALDSTVDSLNAAGRYVMDNFVTPALNFQPITPLGNANQHPL